MSNRKEEATAPAWNYPKPAAGSIAELWTQTLERYGRLQRMLVACREGGPDMAAAIAPIDEQLTGVDTDCDASERITYLRILGDMDEVFARFNKPAINHMMRRNIQLLRKIRATGKVTSLDMAGIETLKAAAATSNSNLQTAETREEILHYGAEASHLSHVLFKQLRQTWALVRE